MCYLILREIYTYYILAKPRTNKRGQANHGNHVVNVLLKILRIYGFPGFILVACTIVLLTFSNENQKNQFLDITQLKN